MTALIDRAHSMATAAHEGQTDKAGAPYIDHPRRVAIRVHQYAPEEHSEAAQAVAWLHDVVEDSSITLQDLAQEFPPRSWPPSRPLPTARTRPARTTTSESRPMTWLEP